MHIHCIIIIIIIRIKLTKNLRQVQQFSSGSPTSEQIGAQNPKPKKNSFGAFQSWTKSFGIWQSDCRPCSETVEIYMLPTSSC